MLMTRFAFHSVPVVCEGRSAATGVRAGGCPGPCLRSALLCFVLLCFVLLCFVLLCSALGLLWSLPSALCPPFESLSQPHESPNSAQSQVEHLEVRASPLSQARGHARFFNCKNSLPADIAYKLVVLTIVPRGCSNFGTRESRRESYQDRRGIEHTSIERQ